MSKGFSIFIEEAIRYRKYCENPSELGRKVKELVQRCIPNPAIYIFGSAIRGKYTAGSDIDILVVVPSKQDREMLDKLKAEIILEIDAPMEIHIATREEFEKWYRKFIDPGEIMEIH